MITKLTKAQEAMIPKYIEEYRAIGLNTNRCNRQKAEAAVTALYLHQKRPQPEFVWVESPHAGTRLAAQLEKGSEDVTRAEVQAQANDIPFGSFEAFWVVLYAFAHEQLKVDNLVDVEIAKNIVKECGVYWPFEDIVVMSDKPVGIHMKDGKLHNPNGLALEYSDGHGIFALEGQVYPSLLQMTIKAYEKK